MSGQPIALAVIPARGGSKGVPDKNIRPLLGKPLIAYSIETALAARDLFHRVIVSTDSAKIADIARELGADVPFLRPAELADDRAPMAPALKHAVETVEMMDGVTIGWVCLLQPTAPLRVEQDIREAMRLALEGETDSVISVVRVYSTHPVLMKKIENGRLVPFCVEEKEGTRRQDYNPPAYMRNGAIYITRRDALVKTGSIWGKSIRPYVMPDERSSDINNEADFELVEILMRRRLDEKDRGA